MKKMSQSPALKWVLMPLMLIPIFLVGGVMFLILGAISEELPRFFKWADSLPLWGIWIIYIFFGLIAYWLYRKLPKSDDE